MPESFLTEDHEILKDAARKFAQKELIPVPERPKNNRIPDWMIKKVGELGYMGMAAEEKYGGLGMDMVSLGVVVEEFGKVDITATTLVTVSAQACFLLESGSEAQRQKWIPRLCKGELIVALALTDSGCGTDAAAINMKATKDGDYYILNGEKARSAGQCKQTSFLCGPRPTLRLENAGLVVS